MQLSLPLLPSATQCLSTTETLRDWLRLTHDRVMPGIQSGTSSPSRSTPSIPGLTGPRPASASPEAMDALNRQFGHDTVTMELTSEPARQFTSTKIEFTAGTERNEIRIWHPNVDTLVGSLGKDSGPRPTFDQVIEKQVPDRFDIRSSSLEALWSVSHMHVWRLPRADLPRRSPVFPPV